MVFEKEFHIHDKMFTDSDIRALWHVVSDQKNLPMAGSAEIVVKNDDGNVSAEDDTIFNTTNFRLKDIKKIEMRYRSNNFTSQISISIQTTELPSIFSQNSVEIRGASEEWVEATTAKLRDIIRYVAPTSWFTRMYLRVGRFVAPLMIFSVLFISFQDYIVPMIREMAIHVYVKLALAILYFGIGAVCAWRSFDMGNLFLVVSIDINGKMKARREKIARVILWLVGVLLIPVLLCWLSVVLAKQHTFNSGDEKLNSSTCCVTNVIDRK